MTLSPAAEVQRRLWGTDPQAWAELAEAHNRPLFEAVLDAAQRRRRHAAARRRLRQRPRDGAGAERGALPSGIDISPGLLGVARERLPQADLREGDMEELPFDDAAFDAVIGINAFQFAGDPPTRAVAGGARPAPRRPPRSRACSRLPSARRARSCTRR